MILQEKENNIIDVPESEIHEVTEDTTLDTPNEAIEDVNNPLGGQSIKNITTLLKNLQDMLKIMETQWKTSQREFKLTNEQVQKVYEYNESYYTPMPDNLTQEEIDKYDRFNGLDHISEETVLEIFGEGHPIIGVENTVTIDRLKDCMNDFIAYVSAMKEYKQVHDAYMQLIENEEDRNIAILEDMYQKETDPDKKAKMEENLNKYYDKKYLNFLSESMTDDQKNRLINTFSDGKKIEYWIKRTREKLKQLNISEQFILELSQFEKRFMDEKYHKCSNMLLLYFMGLVIYSDIYNSKSESRGRVIAMVIVLDSVIRKVSNEKTTEMVMNNIQSMLDQLIDDIPVTKN